MQSKFLYVPQYLGENKERNEKEEKSIDEASQSLGPDITIAILVICFPLCDDSRHQASHQPCTVKEHVEGVGNEPQWIRPDTLDKFHKCECQIKQEEAQQVSWVGIGDNQPDPR